MKYYQTDLKNLKIVLYENLNFINEVMLFHFIIISFLFIMA